MILLIDNYDSFTFNLYHFLGEVGAQGGTFECEVWRNDKLSVADAIAMQPEAIVLSPGPCTPTEAGICLDLIAAAAGKIPLLGVCLGHQAIGQAFGGKVIRAPEPMHGKVSAITHAATDILHSLPSPFRATRYHGHAPSHAACVWRAIPPGEHRQRTRPYDPRQLPGYRPRHQCPCPRRLNHGRRPEPVYNPSGRR